MNEAVNKRGQVNRLFFSALISTGVTLGIFLIMQLLVKVETVVLEPSAFRPLSVIVMKDESPEKLVPKKRLVERMVAPTPPKLDPVQNNVHANMTWEFSEPSVFEPRLPRESVERFTSLDVSIDRTFAQAIRQPMPVYPREALKKGLSGSCEVYFSVDPLGKPYGITAECSDDVFRRSAENAVRKALFAAKTKKGVPVAQGNLVYPLLYEMND